MEILGYTREPLEDILYAARLGGSMHLAWREDQGKFHPFHHNEGILYAKAVENKEDGTLCAKSLAKPWIFELGEGDYGIVAVRTEAEGEPDQSSAGSVLFFATRDFVHYEERGLWKLWEEEVTEVRCRKGGESLLVCFRTQDGTWMEGRGEYPHHLTDIKTVSAPSIPAQTFTPSELEEIQGVIPGNVMEIPESLGDYLKKKLLVPVCEGITLTRTGPDSMKAVARYSDGTEVARGIDWEEQKDGRVRGRIHQEHFRDAFAPDRGDPMVMLREGKYYFVATNDADGNHTLYMRCSDTLEGLMDAEEVLMLDSDTYPEIGGLLWAPEFHEIEGKLYIFHGAARRGEFYREESRVRELQEGGDPICPEHWSRPHLVVKKDGSPLCEEGKVISLDMTTFLYQGEYYAMWSQRQFIPVDQGAWLYLAKIDPQEPWRLVTDPVCIAKPEYGWENNHTFVVEGPFCLEHEGQLMITYSGAAVDATYAVGLLKPVMGTDILDPKNWRKSNYPLLSSRSAPGLYGPGHNSFLEDQSGLTWNFYHARPGVEGPRSACARRVHFDPDGEPRLDLLEEWDLPEKWRDVEVEIEKE